MDNLLFAIGASFLLTAGFLFIFTTHYLLLFLCAMWGVVFLWGGNEDSKRNNKRIN